jgi:hypothetical protein
VKVQKSRCNTGAFLFKCDYGPHTEEFYLCIGGNDAISDGGRKRSADASVGQTTHKRKATPDYKEKHSNEFNMFANVYTDGHYNYEMEVVNFDYLSDVSSSDAPPRGHGLPHKVINYCSNSRFARRNQELTVMLGLAEEERLELVTTVREQEKARVALSSPRREMDDLKMKAAALKKNTTEADKLVEAQEQVDAEMAEESVARDFLRDVIVNDAT